MMLPLDVMVLMDAPANTACRIEVRLIGIIDAKQTEDGKTEKNDRPFAFAIHSDDHENLMTIE